MKIPLPITTEKELDAFVTKVLGIKIRGRLYAKGIVAPGMRWYMHSLRDPPFRYGYHPADLGVSLPCWLYWPYVKRLRWPVMCQY